MLGRGRRRGGISQQQNQQQEECDDSSFYYSSKEMSSRRRKHRKSLALLFALVGTFALGLMQVATLDQHDSKGLIFILTNINTQDSDQQSTIINMNNANAPLPSSPTNAGADVQRRHLREDKTNTISPAAAFPRTFVGIFTTLEDSSKDWHRQNLLKYPKQICALGDYESNKLSSSERDACQVIYTFVIGGNDNPNAPPELLAIPEGGNSMTSKKHHSLLAKTAGRSLPKDVHENDCTLLNIRENEHEGKSQTFFFFASLLLKEEEEQANNVNGSTTTGATTIDYVMKVDAQTKVNWGHFFEFAIDQLSPAPYNTNTIGGALRDKAMWWGDYEATDEEFRKGQGYDSPSKVKQRKLNKPPNKPHPSQMDRLESFWGNEFGGVHLYVDGQLYFMSSDLCHFVANEALYAKSRIGFGGYLEGMEDHDISGMVWHAPSPIHMVPLTKSQRFWQYPTGPE